MDATQLGLAVIGPAGAILIAWAWVRQATGKMALALEETRNRYAEALRQHDVQTELFRTLFEAAPECVKLQNAKGEVERINAAGLALLETEQASHIVGKSVFSVIAPEHRDAYRRLTDEVLAGGSRILEFQLLTFRGKRRWLETHAVPMRDGLGEISGVLAITRDIDERKRMNQQLEEQRNRLRTIIESEPECVKLQDRSGVIMEMNPAGLSLLSAARPEEVIGRKVYDFLDGDYRESYRQLTERVFAGERHSMEFEINTIDGKRRWLETHAAPLLDASGHVTALLAITRDIDERKCYEEKLRRQRNELAHVCRLGTLGELASGLAHELKQPLCAISSYAESAVLLNKQTVGTDPREIEEILQKIVHQTERANDIIQRLREFVRKRAPQPQINRAGDLIAEALDFAEAELKRRQIQVQLDIPDILPDIWVDRVQIEQVLLNLINNAIQATGVLDTGSRKLLINVRHDAAQISICVRDFSAGVAKTLRPRLFIPFFTTKRDGIGMGLALSRGIVESYGGQLVYEPADPGSIFRLTLPCRVLDA